MLSTHMQVFYCMKAESEEILQGEFILWMDNMCDFYNAIKY